MKLLSLDLELNQPSGKVIQVGACILSQQPKNKGIIDSLSIFVNPNEALDPWIIGYTGITQADVDLGCSVLEAYQQLRAFAKKHQVFHTPLVWGSGTWNDSSYLYDQAKPGAPNFMGHRVWDVKTLYQMWQSTNGRTYKGGLGAAINKCGMVFQGRPHNALSDAINTALLYKYLSDFLKHDPEVQNR